MPPTRPAPNMKRGIIGLVVLELMLALLWIYLASLDLGNVEFQSRVGQAIGITMGGLLGLFAVLFLIAARRRIHLRATQEPLPKSPNNP